MTIPQYSRPAAEGDLVPGVAETFWAYEEALMTDDLDAMARLFVPDEHTLRGDAAGLLIGHGAITGFRGSRGGAPKRRIVELHVRRLGEDHAATVAITELLRGGRGQQTQVWTRNDGAGPADPPWRCAVAHVMVAPPAFDRRIWRVLGAPLLPATGSGSLDGETVAVKDLFAVAGQRIGAGNPEWLAEAGPEPRSAAAVARLLAAGASVTGIATTDELALSLAGTNAHYGTPPNPRAPHRISGGSTSGPASAVSLGHATIGLGTDTGGSIRVPAAYQGLWGIRTTHGLLPREGLVPLAASFDTIGWLTRTPALLAAVAEVLVPQAGQPPRGLRFAEAACFELADDEVSAACRAGVASLEGLDRTDAVRIPGVEEAGLQSWFEAFRVIQLREAWAAHGAWVGAHWEQMAPDVGARFRAASRLSADDETAARRVAAEARREVRSWVGDGVLAVPSASSVAPLSREAGIGGEVIEEQRRRTMTLTCLAGLAGLPAVSVPLETAGGLPAGLSLVGPPGSDRALIAYAARLAPETEEGDHAAR